MISFLSAVVALSILWILCALDVILLIRSDDETICPQKFGRLTFWVVMTAIGLSFSCAAITQQIVILNADESALELIRWVMGVCFGSGAMIWIWIRRDVSETIKTAYIQKDEPPKEKRTMRRPLRRHP